MKTLLAFLYSSLVWAAPHPLTASSIVNNPQNNFAYSMMGFKVSSIPTGWSYKNSPEENGMSIELGPTDMKSKASLIFHEEKVPKKITLEQYVRQYLRDYNQYGFEVVSLQSNKKNLVPSVIVDLTQKNKQTRSRQVFFLQNEKMIVASCLDNYDSFDKTVATCNQILGSFQWNKPDTN